MIPEKMKRNTKQQQTECYRCGTCCTKGGPALHGQDLSLIINGHLTRSALITIRKGELAHNPKADAIRPVSCELIKIRGKAGEWTCLFYDESTRGCTIYHHRPFACTLLKCWDPKELLDLVEKDTLSRFDILEETEPMYSSVLEYERLFPCPDMLEIAGWLEDDFKEKGVGLEKVVNDDLSFRDRLVREKSLELNEELFLFGRPLFQLLQPLGFSVVQGPTGIRLLQRKSERVKVL